VLSSLHRRPRGRAIAPLLSELTGGRVPAGPSPGDAAGDLLASGHHFHEVFGEDGDWGVTSEEWGTAYMTLEWLAEQATPGFSVASYAPARIDSNQDLVVLRREEGGR